MKKLFIISAVALVAACGETNPGTTGTDTQQYGESCDTQHRCVSGLYCENGTCRTVCTSNSGCNHMQTCQDGRCVNNANNTCNTGWAGTSCAECAPNYYGSQCTECPDCGDHGTCDNGLKGKGTCKCESGWEGDKCQNQSSCPEGFTGENCDQCAKDYYGLQCKACTCKHGECNNTKNGDGFCREETCEDGFEGKNCDKCIDPLKTGKDCDQCVNSKFTGENCDQCADSKFTGKNCDQCANSHFTGENCDQCAANLAGQDCNIENKCKNGEPNLGLNGNGLCIKCNPGWDGQLCDTCINGTEDTMTDTAGNSYKTKCINHQVWMIENMGIEKGDFHDTDTNHLCENFSQCWGYIYKYATALTLCPNGWRLPGISDFENLLGESLDKEPAASPIWWYGEGNNTTGFTATPVGFCYNLSGDDVCSRGAEVAYWTTDVGEYHDSYDNKTNELYQYQDLYVVEVFSKKVKVITLNSHSSFAAVRCIKE